MSIAVDFAWWQMILGLLISLAFGPLIKCIYKKVDVQIKSRYESNLLPEPARFTRKEWNEMVADSTPGGDWLGHTERVIFFAAFVWHWALAASYLGFKLASKWKTWTTTWEAIKLPDDATPEDRNQTAKAHYARTGREHRLFTLGTACNLVAGAVGYAVALMLPTFVSFAAALWSCVAAVR